MAGRSVDGHRPLAIRAGGTPAGCRHHVYLLLSDAAQPRGKCRHPLHGRRAWSVLARHEKDLLAVIDVEFHGAGFFPIQRQFRLLPRTEFLHPAPRDRPLLVADAGGRGPVPVTWIFPRGDHGIAFGVCLLFLAAVADEILRATVCTRGFRRYGVHFWREHDGLAGPTAISLLSIGYALRCLCGAGVRRTAVMVQPPACIAAGARRIPWGLRAIESHEHLPGSPARRDSAVHAASEGDATRILAPHVSSGNAADRRRCGRRCALLPCYLWLPDGIDECQHSVARL